MQETRYHILQILRARGEAAVDDIVADLRAARGAITHVTVRHHLAVLQQEGYILSEARLRPGPGRPRLLYRLTEAGRTVFPNNFRRLAVGLLTQIERTLPHEQVNVLFEGLGKAMAEEAQVSAHDWVERLNEVTAHLNANGYDASWEAADEGYLLHTRNCPYHRLDTTGRTLCRMDLAYIAGLLGVVPRLASHMAEGDSTCSYFIPASHF